MSRYQEKYFRGRESGWKKYVDGKPDYADAFEDNFSRVKKRYYRGAIMEVTVIKSNRKTMAIQVDFNQNVTVRVPYSV